MVHLIYVRCTLFNRRGVELALSETFASNAEDEGEPPSAAASMSPKILATAGGGVQQQAAFAAKSKAKINKPFLLSDMDGKVRAFLDRMRNQESLNASIPREPTARSFQGTAFTFDFSSGSGKSIHVSSTCSMNNVKRTMPASLFQMRTILVTRCLKRNSERD